MRGTPEPGPRRVPIEVLPGWEEDRGVVADKEMLQLALEGFRAASARVAAAPATTALSMYVPLTEAAWWAVCVDEALERAPGYKSRRNSAERGKTVAGLHYARSALGHKRTFIAEPGGGLTIPFTIPFTITVYPRWLPTSELPSVDGRGVWARPCYDERVAGRPVRDTLADAEAWFAESGLA